MWSIYSRLKPYPIFILNVSFRARGVQYIRRIVLYRVSY